MDDCVKTMEHIEPTLTQDAAFQRVIVRGKFLWAGHEKFWVKGVSYGAFRPDAAGNEYWDDAKIERDFALMATNGINTVRIPHTMPPRSLLDIAQRFGLRVMVGLSAEQYVGFLIDKKKAPDVTRIVREKVRAVAGHPALLCYAVGNEIQASSVRWIGRKPVERYIRRVYRAIKAEDPDGLVTYVNYPTTEYLDLPFLDLLAFNVYLESRDRLAAYLGRLQNLAGDRPLLMSEIGLDSLRNGQDAQAKSLDWQIRTAFAEGCVGVVVFAWTDEWFRGEAEVDDWAFGLTDRERNPKPALAAVTAAFTDAPFPPDTLWPKVSVVVCSYNGARTIRDTLEGLKTVEYPDYEVIVVNDGSTDATPEIAAEYDVRLISTENRGLSNARNTGWQEATGEIIAYIDDDAYPDPHWLKYLAWTFLHHDFVGVGGPNIAPGDDGPIAECVYNAPGGPVHVLLTDRIAEHIPGCNMAFRRDALAKIGGFDARYRAAGDDVDLCWRLQDAGGAIGFHAAAMDWHHRRNSVRMYWKQQQGYGKAEALLEEKWPERYNTLGHATWGGRLYGTGLTLPVFQRQHVYGGVMGNAPFQSLYPSGPSTWLSLPLMPEWYLLIALLMLLAVIGVGWPPLLWTSLPLLVIAILLPVLQAGISAGKATFMRRGTMARTQKGAFWSITAFLHLIQPLARLRGRLRHGLAPWRMRGDVRPAWPWPQSNAVWTERWAPPESRVHTFTDNVRASGYRYFHGGPYDRWDLQLIGGALGGARTIMAVEDHGGGAHFIRLRYWPRPTTAAVVGVALFSGLAALAASSGAWATLVLLSLLGMMVVVRSAHECAISMGAAHNAWEKYRATLSGAE